MPWDSKGLMLLKEEFIRKIEGKAGTVTQLCQKYKISRKTGYKWLSRFRRDGILGLSNRSRKPLRMHNRTDQLHTNLILSARDKYPAWGARKLRQVLLNEGNDTLPSESTFNRVLKREGKIDFLESQKRKEWIRFEREKPNELWQMDFKGCFITKEGRCYPLTILDDCSRYSICLKACSGEDEISVRSGLEDAFRTYGLPEAMTMDNGNPWRGAPPTRFSRLTVWLMRLGIKVGHSRPCHPQTQGKDERFHRSLKEEVLKYHNFANLAEAQTSFNEWRFLYNNIRPHEGIGMICPIKKYQPSSRLFPEKLISIEYQRDDEVRRVSSAGEIKFKGANFFVGESFTGETVALRSIGEHRWDIYYVNSWLGSFKV